MYLILYGAFIVWFLFDSFKDHGSFDFFGFLMYNAVTVSFITTVIMIVSLIWEIIAKKGGKHIFTIVQLAISVAVSVFFYIWARNPSDLTSCYVYPALNLIVWSCWGIEFVKRELC